MGTPEIWLAAGGVVFLAAAALGAVWRLRGDAARRERRFAEHYGGDVARILQAAGPDEVDALRAIRRHQGDHAAAIRLRRVDRNLPFERLLEAARTLAP